MRQALTEDPAAFGMLAAMTTATDERLRNAAIRLAAAIVLDWAGAARPTARGLSRLRPVRGAIEGDLDIDACVDAIAEARSQARPVGREDLTTVTWAKAPTAFAVVVDRSGSMSGSRLGSAAVIAAACALRASREHAVLTFAGTVDVIRPLVSELPAATVAERLLGLRGHGTTSLAAALRAAQEQLSDAKASRRVVVLLSDCRATGEDHGVSIARAIPELIILAPADDHDQAAHLALQSGARWAPVTHPQSAAEALDHLLHPQTS